MGLPLKPRRLFKLRRGQEGSAVVEFALCLIPLILILGGIIDYGQIWYMQSVLTTASREGARYATKYQTDPGTGARLTPDKLSPSVASYLTVTENYPGLLPADADFSVTTPWGTGYTTGSGPVYVKVNAKKYWFFLGNLVPGLTNPQPLSSTTVMTCE
jgi:Flp pilus assembly protein TadG